MKQKHKHEWKAYYTEHEEHYNIDVFVGLRCKYCGKILEDDAIERLINSINDFKDEDYCIKYNVEI